MSKFLSEKESDRSDRVLAVLYIQKQMKRLKIEETPANAQDAARHSRRPLEATFSVAFPGRSGQHDNARDIISLVITDREVDRRGGEREKRARDAAAVSRGSLIPKNPRKLDGSVTASARRQNRI